MLRGRTPVFPDFRNLRVFVAQISLISTIETLLSVSSEQSPIFIGLKKHEKQARIHFIPALKDVVFVTLRAPVVINNKKRWCPF